MDKPYMIEPSFMVWTTQETQAAIAVSRQAKWLWAAWGPRGYDSGAEVKPEHALEKAYAARHLLSDPERR